MPEVEYKAKFEEAKKEVLLLGFEPVSPLDLPHNHERTWGAYMREDLIAMLQCDSVYALSNWRFSPGAKIEINLALDIGLNIIQQITKK